MYIWIMLVNDCSAHGEEEQHAIDLPSLKEPFAD
jgi:hypothetical protein